MGLNGKHPPPGFLGRYRAVSLARAEPRGGAVKLPEGRVEPHGRGGVVKLTDLVQPTDDDEYADKSGSWAVL